MDSKKQYLDTLLSQRLPKIELTSPFLEEIFADTKLQVLESLDTTAEMFLQETPFLKVFENIELDLDRFKTQGSESLLQDADEEKSYLSLLNDEINTTLEQADDSDEEELLDLEYSQQETYDQYEVLDMGEQVREKNSLLPRMKFEFQTSNRVWRNDGRTTASLLPRKYGPEDFLIKKKRVRLESENKGVLEFETEWFHKWSALEKAISKAVKMTDDMNDSKPSKFESKRKAFPFDVAHLRTGSRNERNRGFWNKKNGMEGKNEKILGAKEELEVELTDRDINGHSTWEAAIQSSECFLLHQYENYLIQHEEPVLAELVIKKAKEILDAVRPKEISVTQFVNLNSFLQLVVYYITRGQRVGVKGSPSKYAFQLMSRTDFSSIFRRLLRRDERRLFYKTVRNNEILNKMGLTREHPFFIEGYGSKKHQDRPTIFKWLVGFFKGKDLLSGRSGKGLSASMGRYHVENRRGKKDRWLVKFETRNTIMGRVKEARDWVSYASSLYTLASKRRRRPVSWILLPLGNKAERFLDYIGVNDVSSAISLAYQQGIINEDKLTNLVFHSFYPELLGRRILKKERVLAQKWLRIRNDLVQPFLQSTNSHEVMEYVNKVQQDGGESGDLFINEWEDDFLPKALTENTNEVQSHKALMKIYTAIEPLEEQEIFGEELDDEFAENKYVDDELDEVEVFHHSELWKDQDRLEVTDDPFNAEDVDGDDVLDELEEPELDEFHESETGSRTTDYDKALKHALKNPKPRNFAAPWRRDGGKFDTRYWKKRADPDPGWYKDGNGKWKRHRWSMLEIINDGDAYDAIKSMIAHPQKWTYDCAVFVQATHLYALAVSRGKLLTNAYYAKTKLRLRFHWSPGLLTRKSYRKDARNGSWRVRSEGSEREVILSAAKVLRSTPFGSRVMWHNIRGERSWKNENTVKVGNNRYRGFPLFRAKPMKGWKIEMGLAAHQVFKDDHNARNSILLDIESATGTDVKNKKKLQNLWRYAKQYIYLREVEIIGPDPNV